jgi:hypothetical protein
MLGPGRQRAFQSSHFFFGAQFWVFMSSCGLARSNLDGDYHHVGLATEGGLSRTVTFELAFYWRCGVVV